MPAIVRVEGQIATFDKKLGVWTCENDDLAVQLNRRTSMREYLGHSTLSYFKENLDYERTIAEYIVEHFGGEIVNVTPYSNENNAPDAIY